MCGIVGIVRLGLGPCVPLDDTIEAMTATLQHRGPDSQGVWVDNQIGVALGHTRLAIRDPSPLGAQPMQSRSGRHIIAYNGEVYSQKELRRMLPDAGGHLAGHSDTEIILEASEHFGFDRVVQDMIGMFALALYDRDTGELLLCRDRMGLKPMYWSQVNGHLIFASELKALERFPEWQPRLDRRSLSSYMRHNYIPTPNSIYQDVAKLGAGQILRVSRQGRISMASYWDLPALAQDGIRARRDRSEIEAFQRVDGLLTDAVQRRLVSDVPVGALLSGGIDSSLVTALMVEASPTTVNTFSIGFDLPGFNEAPQAAEIARHLGTNHTELYVDPQAAIDTIPLLPTIYDEPFADSSQIPTFLVSQLTRDHVSVVLTGDGGDELFAGYNRYEIALALSAGRSRIPRAAQAWIARQVLRQPVDRIGRASQLIPARWRRPAFGERVHRVAEGIAQDDPNALYRSMVSHWHDPSTVVIDGKERGGPLWDTRLARMFPDQLDRMQLLDMLTYLPDDILVKVDRASMAVALEARVPLLDHRLVEESWRLPQAMKLRHSESKWVLRQLLYRRVPRALVDRPKMGFGIPIDVWLRGPLKEWGADLLSHQLLRRQGVLDPKPVLSKWEAHQNGENWAYPLWNILMFQAWLENHPEVSLA